MSKGYDGELTISFIEYLITKSLIFEFEEEEHAITSIKDDVECYGMNEIVESVDKLIERLNTIKTILNETQRE